MSRKNKKYLKKAINSWYKKAEVLEKEVEGFEGLKYLCWNIDKLNKKLHATPDDIGKQVWVAENNKTEYSVIRDVKQNDDGEYYYIIQDKGSKMRRQRMKSEIIIHPEVYYDMEE